jgi:hypothetical protein
VRPGRGIGGKSEYRSMRMTGRMITVPECDLSAVDFPLHAPRAGVGILMIVPKSLSPTPGSTRHDQSPVARYKSSQG